MKTDLENLIKEAEKVLYDDGFEDLLMTPSFKGSRRYISELMANFANAKAKALLKEAAEKNLKLVSALEDAITGLEWEIENRPELDHRADEEKLHEWKELVNSLSLIPKEQK